MCSLQVTAFSDTESVCFSFELASIEVMLEKLDVTSRFEFSAEQRASIIDLLCNFIGKNLRGRRITTHVSGTWEVILARNALVSFRDFPEIVFGGVLAGCARSNPFPVPRICDRT